MKKIIFVKGKLETLDYFVEQMMDGLKESDIDVYVVDVNKPDTYGEKLVRYVATGDCSLITFNQIGVKLESDGENFWKKNGIKVYDIIVDHPYNYDDELNSPSVDYTVVVIDREHAEFIKKYYPKIKDIVFLPHGGNEVEGKLPYEDRDIDVVYVGNCQEETPWVAIEDFEDRGAEFYQTTMGILMQNPNMTIEKAIELYLQVKGIDNYELAKKLILNYGVVISNNIRRYYKLRVMHTIESTGAVVDIYGDGWGNEEWRENIHLHKRISSEECNRRLGQAKIGLNCLPWFKDGSNERVYNAMLNGAISLTDTSGYLIEEFGHGEDIVFYNLDNMDELKENVSWLLANPQAAKHIADRGYEVAKRKHTWGDRIKEIVRV